MYDQNQPNQPSAELTQSFWQAWRKQQGQSLRQTHLLLQRGRQLLDRFQHFYDRLGKLSRPAQRRWQRKLGASLAGVALTLALSSVPAQAATITVDGSTCTLVDAITAANSDTGTGGCVAGSGADTLTLSGNVTLTAVNNTTYGGNGLPVITSAITIAGTGFTIARDAGAPNFRIFDVAGGNLTLNATTISGGNLQFAGPGGGIRTSNGTVTLNNSTVNGNTIYGSSYGGGIASLQSTLTLNNSTISGNTAGGISGGGGINSYQGTLILNNSTVSGNTASVGSEGGGISSLNGTTTLNNSIVANNGGVNCRGVFASAGYNLDSDGSCNLTAVGDIPSGLANLGPLQVNPPGNTPTHALLPGSHAIDAGNCSGGTITTDQRGVARPQGPACDIGAFELEQSANLPPNCAAASASPNTLWPPNHAFKPITINGVSDPDGNPVTLSVTSIFQDEAVNAPGSGNTAPDGQGVGSATAQVRAERVGGANGRVYTIAFAANDGQGGTCTGTVQVGVPHDKKDTPVDGGPLFDSTVTP